MDDRYTGVVPPDDDDSHDGPTGVEDTSAGVEDPSTGVGAEDDESIHHPQCLLEHEIFENTE